MALIKCPECGKDISDAAKACPGCGAPRVLWVRPYVPLPIEDHALPDDIPAAEPVTEPEPDVPEVECEPDFEEPPTKREMTLTFCLMGLVIAAGIVLIILASGSQ